MNKILKTFMAQILLTSCAITCDVSHAYAAEAKAEAEADAKMTGGGVVVDRSRLREICEKNSLFKNVMTNFEEFPPGEKKERIRGILEELLCSANSVKLQVGEVSRGIPWAIDNLFQFLGNMEANDSNRLFDFLDDCGALSNNICLREEDKYRGSAVFYNLHRVYLSGGIVQLNNIKKLVLENFTEKLSAFEDGYILRFIIQELADNICGQTGGALVEAREALVNCAMNCGFMNEDFANASILIEIFRKNVSDESLFPKLRDQLRGLEKKCALRKYFSERRMCESLVCLALSDNNLFKYVTRNFDTIEKEGFGAPLHAILSLSQKERLPLIFVVVESCSEESGNPGKGQDLLFGFERILRSGQNKFIFQKLARALCLQINNPKINSGSLESYINNPSPLDEPIDVLVAGAGAGAGAGSGSGSSAGAGDPSASADSYRVEDIRVKDLDVIGDFLNSIIFPASASIEDMIRIVIESVCLSGMQNPVKLHLPTVILQFVKTKQLQNGSSTKSLAEILKIRIPG
jgi:hypothetical protein